MAHGASVVAKVTKAPHVTRNIAVAKEEEDDSEGGGQSQRRKSRK